MAIYPTISDIDSIEDLHLEVKRSLLSILSGFALFAVTLLIVLILASRFQDLSLAGTFPIGSHVSSKWLFLIPMGIMAEVIRRYHNELYVFEHHSLTVHEGRLAMTYSVPEVNYVDIRTVVVEQDIVGRIFDYGDIFIGTAAQDKIEVWIQGVRDPRALADLIDELRSRSAKLINRSGMEGDYSDGE